MNIYNVPIDKGMVLNVFATDANEATDLLNLKLILYVTFLGIVPSILIFKTKIVYKNVVKEVVYRVVFSMGLLVIILILAGVQYRQISTFVRTTKNNFDYLLPRNYLWSLIKITKGLREMNQELIIIGNDIKIEDDNTLVIIAVGETARKANFSLYGYKRDTNPLLKNDNVLTLKNTSSCGTATKISLPCMFSHLRRSEFIRNNKNYEFLPTLLARSGVDVLYKDNNFGGCKDTCNNTESISTINLKSQEFCSSGECVDGILLDKLEKYIINHNNNTMIVLHQNGSHGPRYNKRYPKEFEKFTPVCTNSDVSKCTQEELINAYDNTILYTDNFLHNIIKIAQENKRPTVIIYISDHGESLGENNIYLHGFPYLLAPKEQKEIPFIVWMSESFKKKHNINNNCFNKKNYSHDNLFHSVLGTFNAKTELYNKELDIFHCQQ
jgi:lipid A ethanolaminephosphotransferase